MRIGSEAWIATQEQRKIEEAAKHKCHTKGCNNMTTNYWCDECHEKRREKYR